MLATGGSPWVGISTTSQPRAKRKLDRAQPQEKGRHRSCAAPFLEAALYRACASRGASAECQSKTTGSRPWLKLYRRSAAKMANLQSRGFSPRSPSLRNTAIETETRSCQKASRLNYLRLSSISVVDIPPPAGRIVARTRAEVTRSSSSGVVSAVPSGLTQTSRLGPLFVCGGSFLQR